MPSKKRYREKEPEPAYVPLARAGVAGDFISPAIEWIVARAGYTGWTALQPLPPDIQVHSELATRLLEAHQCLRQADRLANSPLGHELGLEVLFADEWLVGHENSPSPQILQALQVALNEFDTLWNKAKTYCDEFHIRLDLNLPPDWLSSQVSIGERMALVQLLWRTYCVRYPIPLPYDDPDSSRGAKQVDEEIQREMEEQDSKISPALEVAVPGLARKGDRPPEALIDFWKDRGAGTLLYATSLLTRRNYRLLEFQAQRANQPVSHG